MNRNVFVFDKGNIIKEGVPHEFPELLITKSSVRAFLLTKLNLKRSLFNKQNNFNLLTQKQDDQ